MQSAGTFTFLCFLSPLAMGMVHVLKETLCRYQVNLAEDMELVKELKSEGFYKSML